MRGRSRLVFRLFPRAQRHRMTTTSGLKYELRLLRGLLLASSTSHLAAPSAHGNHSRRRRMEPTATPVDVGRQPLGSAENPGLGLISDSVSTPSLLTCRKASGKLAQCSGGLPQMPCPCHETVIHYQQYLELIPVPYLLPMALSFPQCNLLFHLPWLNNKEFETTYISTYV